MAPRAWLRDLRSNDTAGAGTGPPPRPELRDERFSNKRIQPLWQGRAEGALSQVRRPCVASAPRWGHVSDEFTHECPIIMVDRSVDDDKVVASPGHLRLERRAPALLGFKNGLEFISLSGSRHSLNRMGIACSFHTIWFGECSVIYTSFTYLLAVVPQAHRTTSTKSSLAHDSLLSHGDTTLQCAFGGACAVDTLKHGHLS